MEENIFQLCPLQSCCILYQLQSDLRSAWRTRRGSHHDQPAQGRRRKGRTRRAAGRGPEGDGKGGCGCARDVDQVRMGNLPGPGNGWRRPVVARRPNAGRTSCRGPWTVDRGPWTVDRGHYTTLHPPNPSRHFKHGNPPLLVRVQPGGQHFFLQHPCASQVILSIRVIDNRAMSKHRNSSKIFVNLV